LAMLKRATILFPVPGYRAGYLGVGPEHELTYASLNFWLVGLTYAEEALNNPGGREGRYHHHHI